uniref:Uncharacterized protein n=1 Tax=Vespula pensylvanica TaxID=30213 RepID=A0A834PCX4_VESPE|nr:hypothetical protein H0235_004032 [Vespula pensylvanica]
MQSAARLRASSQEFEDTREKSGLKFRSKSCHVLAVSPELTPEKGIRNTADLAGTACKASKANTEAAFRPRASPGAKSTCDEFKIDSFAHTDASFKSNPALFDRIYIRSVSDIDAIDKSVATDLNKNSLIIERSSYEESRRLDSDIK